MFISSNSSSSSRWPSFRTTNTTTHSLAYFVKDFYFYMTRRWYCIYCSNNMWNTVWMPSLPTYLLHNPQTQSSRRRLLQQHHQHNHTVCGHFSNSMSSLSTPLTSSLCPCPLPLAVSALTNSFHLTSHSLSSVCKWTFWIYLQLRELEEDIVAFKDIVCC